MGKVEKNLGLIFFYNTGKKKTAVGSFWKNEICLRK